MVNISSVFALSGVNLRITGVIGEYSSQVTLRTDVNANAGLDAYDMRAPSAPDSYSSFYSYLTTASLAVDSWDETSRADILLVYDMPSSQENGGDLEISWDDIPTSADYDASMTISGQVVVSDMVDDADNKYVHTTSDNSDVSIYITIDHVPEEATTTTTSGGGGGGGGSGDTITLPPVTVIKDVTSGLLLFDTAVLIPVEYKDIFTGDTLKALINLDPQVVSGEPDLDVYLRYYIVDLRTGNQVDVGDGESGAVRLTGQETISKSFFTNTLDPGEYELTLELEYCTKWVEGECKTELQITEATSQFKVNSRKVAEEEAGIFAVLSGYRTILLALGIGIVVLILFIVVIVRSTRKLKKRRK